MIHHHYSPADILAAVALWVAFLTVALIATARLVEWVETIADRIRRRATTTRKDQK